jgi:hypothetical protein
VARSVNKVANSRSNASEKRWRAHANTAERSAVKVALAHQEGEDVVIPLRKEVADNYNSPKDDYCQIFPNKANPKEYADFVKVRRK